MKKGIVLLACLVILLSGCSSEKAEETGAVSRSDVETTMIDGREYSVISTEEELRSIGRTLPLSGNYVLGNDITLTKEWTPLGSEDDHFTGRFEGDGYVIRDLKVNGKDTDQGFFRASDGAAIHELVLEDTEISSVKFFPIVGNAVDTEIEGCQVDQ